MPAPPLPAALFSSPPTSSYTAAPAPRSSSADLLAPRPDRALVPSTALHPPAATPHRGTSGTGARPPPRMPSPVPSQSSTPAGRTASRPAAAPATTLAPSPSVAPHPAQSAAPSGISPSPQTHPRTASPPPPPPGSSQPAVLARSRLPTSAPPPPLRRLHPRQTLHSPRAADTADSGRRRTPRPPPAFRAKYSPAISGRTGRYQSAQTAPAASSAPLSPPPADHFSLPSSRWPRLLISLAALTQMDAPSFAHFA